MISNIYVCRLPPHQALYDGESEPLGWTWDERYPPGIPENQTKTSLPLPSSSQPPSTQTKLASSKSASAQQLSTQSPLQEPATASAVSPKATASESDQVATKPQNTSGEVIYLTDVSDEDKEESSDAEEGSTRMPETQRPCVLVLDSLGCHDARRTRERLAR